MKKTFLIFLFLPYTHALAEQEKTVFSSVVPQETFAESPLKPPSAFSAVTEPIKLKKNKKEESER